MIKIMFFLTIFLVSCTSVYEEPEVNLTGVLKIASFMNESHDIGQSFNKLHPDLDMTIEVIPLDEGFYELWLMSILELGVIIPDVIFLHDDFLYEFIDTPFVRYSSYREMQSGGVWMAISYQSQNPEAAYEFIRFAVNWP